MFGLPGILSQRLQNSGASIAFITVDENGIVYDFNLDINSITGLTATIDRELNIGSGSLSVTDFDFVGNELWIAANADIYEIDFSTFAVNNTFANSFGYNASVIKTIVGDGIYLGDSVNASRVFKNDFAGNQLWQNSRGTFPNTLGLVLSSSYVYTVSNNEGGTAYLRKIDKVTGATLAIVTESNSIEGVALDLDGNVYYSITTIGLRKADADLNHLATFSASLGDGSKVFTYGNTVYLATPKNLWRLDLSLNQIWFSSIATDNSTERISKIIEVDDYIVISKDGDSQNENLVVVDKITGGFVGSIDIQDNSSGDDLTDNPFLVNLFVV